MGVWRSIARAVSLRFGEMGGGLSDTGSGITNRRQPLAREQHGRWCCCRCIGFSCVSSSWWRPLQLVLGSSYSIRFVQFHFSRLGVQKVSLAVIRSWFNDGTLFLHFYSVVHIFIYPLVCVCVCVCMRVCANILTLLRIFKDN